MRLSKKVLSVALAAAVVVGGVAAPAPKKADAAKKYKAMLCFATKKWNHRNEHTSKDNDSLYTEKGVKIGKVSVKNASFKKGKVNFTVSMSGSGMKKMSKDGGYNALFVDTTLPGSMKKKLSISKIVVKVDGKTVKTIKKPVLTPDPGKTASSTQIMAVNMWNSYANKKCKNIKKMPKKRLSITVVGKLK